LNFRAIYQAHKRS